MSNFLVTPMNSSLTGSSVHGISQAIILEWVAMSPGDLPRPGIKPTSTALAGRFFTTELPRKPGNSIIKLLKLEKAKKQVFL